MTAIPARCNQCGYTFPSPFNLAGTTNSMVVGCRASCPRCGGMATVMDSHTDHLGRLHVKDMFEYARTISNVDNLKKLKSRLENEEKIDTAEKLVEALTEIDPAFAAFKKTIKSLPIEKIPGLINLLVALFTLLIAWQTLKLGESQHSDEMNIQREGLELSREQFEYQKLKDSEDRQEDSDREEMEKLNKEIDGLKAKLIELDKELTGVKTKKKVKIKGRERNKPCPCGSGKKSKCCHPYGIFV